MSTKKAVIYISLQGEGTPVLRPTFAKEIDEDIFEVLPTEGYDPDDEIWEYSPGSLVECEEQIRDGKKVLVAVRQHKGH